MKSWTKWYTYLLVVFLLLVGVLWEAVIRGWISSIWSFALLLLILSVALSVIGKGVCGRLGGVLIDDRNRYSVSRLQLVTWNILLLSAYASAVMSNVAASTLHQGCIGAACSDPLLVKLPTELWILAGITNASGLMAPLVLRKLHPGETELAPGQQTPVDPQLRSLAVKPDINDARIGDFFVGERGTDVQTPDIARIQQVFFTVLLAGGYGLAVFHLLADTPLGQTIPSLPNAGEGFLALISVSSAVFLGGKAFPPLMQPGDAGVPRPAN